MLKAASLIIAGIMAVSFVHTANAQYMTYSWGGYRYRESPEVNNYLSARYDYLLQVSPRFRGYHMWKECHTINLPPLQADCLASFDQYEPMLPGYGWWR